MERKAATEHWTTTAVQDAALYRAQLMSPLAKANNGKARVIAVLPVKNNARVLREPAYQVVLFCIRPANLWRTLWRRPSDFGLSVGRSGRI